MIYYTRTQWYGLGYLTRLRGSLLPHCLPAMVLSGTIAGVFSSRWLDQIIGTPLTEYFADAYAMQLAGLVFGYLCVARLNVSYNRYWEGVSHVKSMHSKWADACSQALTFDRIDDPSESVKYDAYCNHIVRLFCQLSAMSMLRLHLEDVDVARTWARVEAELAQQEEAPQPGAPSRERRPSVLAVRRPSAVPSEPAEDGWRARLGAWLRGRPPPKAEAMRRASLAQRRGSVLSRSPVEKNAAVDETLDELKLHKLLTRREATYLRSVPCPVLSTAHRISRAVSTRGRTRGWKAPAPIARTNKR